MKKLIVVSTVLLFLIVPSFMFGSSCDSGPDYYINVTFEGEEYSLTFGDPDYSDNVPYAALIVYTPAFEPQAPAPEDIRFFGASGNLSDMQQPVSFYIEVSQISILSHSACIRVITSWTSTPTSLFSLFKMMCPMSIWTFSKTVRP